MGGYIAGFKTHCGSLLDWWLRERLLTCAWFIWLCYPKERAWVYSCSQQDNPGELSSVGGLTNACPKPLASIKFTEFSNKLKRVPATARIRALSFQWPCSFRSFPSPSAAVSCCHGMLPSSCIALPPPVPWGSEKVWEGLLNFREANWIKRQSLKMTETTACRNAPPVYPSDSTAMLGGSCVRTSCNRLWLFFQALVSGMTWLCENT